MTQSETSAGTPVIEMSEPEHHAFLEREAQASFGMSIADFTARVHSHEIDWDDPEVFYLAGLIGVGQNGDRQRVA